MSCAIQLNKTDCTRHQQRTLKAEILFKKLGSTSPARSTLKISPPCFNKGHVKCDKERKGKTLVRPIYKT